MLFEQAALLGRAPAETPMEFAMVRKQVRP